VRLKSEADALGDVLATKAPAAFAAQLVPLLDGTHNVDEICCGLDINFVQLAAVLRASNTTVTLIK
jgi:hypothetical protein